MKKSTTVAKKQIPCHRRRKTSNTIFYFIINMLIIVSNINSLNICTITGRYALYRCGILLFLHINVGQTGDVQAQKSLHFGTEVEALYNR